jgi:hypothetical protein
VSSSVIGIAWRATKQPAFENAFSGFRVTPTSTVGGGG